MYDKLRGLVRASEVTEIHKSMQNVAFQLVLITLGIHLISSHIITILLVLNLNFLGLGICVITPSHLSYISVFILAKNPKQQTHNNSIRAHFTHSFGRRKIKTMPIHIWGLKLNFFVNWCLQKLFFLAVIAE